MALFGVMAGLLLAVAGCGLSGRWEMLRASPNPDVLAVDDAEFGDGRFEATITRDGRTRVERGNYKFNGWQLYLMPESGGRMKFGSKVRGDRLELRDGTRYVILERAE